MSVSFPRLAAFAVALLVLLPAGLLAAPARTAVISAFPPELAALRAALTEPEEKALKGVAFVTGRLEGRPVVLFPSGISMVNAAMTTQLALDHFPVKRIVFSGIAGGVDPALNIGDVIVAERWGQYLELVLARKTPEGWQTPPFFTYPHANYGMMFPRSVTVQQPAGGKPETRFWFPVDKELLALAREAAEDVTLKRCHADGTCLSAAPRVLIGGNGVSGSAFVDNADFRAYVENTFEARLLDMESAAVAHVAYANGVPFIAFRSLSDLAGGGDGENELTTFFQLAADNAAAVVRAFFARLPD